MATSAAVSFRSPSLLPCSPTRSLCIPLVGFSWRRQCSLEKREHGRTGLIGKATCKALQGPSMAQQGNEELVVGSPIIVVEAPSMVKTAEPMPMMRPNTGIIKPGDVGRIIARKPKDVWAVRLSIGAYLIDRKYFKPLLVDDITP